MEKNRFSATPSVAANALVPVSRAAPAPTAQVHESEPLAVTAANPRRPPILALCPQAVFCTLMQDSALSLLSIFKKARPQQAPVRAGAWPGWRVARARVLHPCEHSQAALHAGRP